MHAHSQKTQTYSKTLVLFDFDGTLCKTDSYSAFLKYVIPKKQFYWRCCRFLPKIISYYLGYYPAHLLRPQLSRQLLQGLLIADLQKKLPSYTSQILTQLNPKVYAQLKWHQQQQHDIYIVSAGLNLYLAPIAHALNVKLICSELDQQQLILTGEYQTPDCSKLEKVNRIKQRIELKNFNYIYAYGNSPEDYEMLQMADHAYFVKGDKIHVFSFKNQQFT